MSKSLIKKNLRVRASLCLRVSLNDKYISDETLREQPDIIFCQVSLKSRR